MLVLLLFLKADHVLTLLLIVLCLSYQCLLKFSTKPVLSRLLDFLNSKHFSYDSQFGFRAKHPTEHARANLLKYIHTFLDSGLIPAALFLDVWKAFGSITHKILLWKLFHTGIRGSTCSWFLSYLPGQFISVDPLFSNPSEFEFGVSQGSLTGPILFLIYVNDLINAVKNLKPTTCCRLCQPTSVTNYDKTSSFSDTFIAFADGCTLGIAGRTESDLRSKHDCLFWNSYSVVWC